MTTNKDKRRSRKARKQSRAPIRKQRPNWLPSIPTIWKVLIFVIGVPGLYIGMLSILPRVSVTVGTFAHSNDAFSAPVTVSNDGYSGINEAELSCRIDHIRDSTGAGLADFSSRSGNAIYDLGSIGADGSASTFCGSWALFPGPIKEGHMDVVLSFRPDFLPWHVTKIFHFRGQSGDNNSFRWIKTST